jgi:curved DNA-binding protein CbpA
MAKDYYAVLNVPRTARPEQIRERFRELAREGHPDRFRGEEKEEAEARFQAITEAFNVLSHPERRRLHDLELDRPESRPAQSLQLLRVYMQRGVKAYRDKNYLEAAENFDRATQADPINAQAWHHLAAACSHNQRWFARATRAVARACELEPMNSEYLKLAGKIHALAGMAAEAERYYNQALTWGGDDSGIQEALEELRRGSKKGRPGKVGS